jgi:hypothetical protein
MGLRHGTKKTKPSNIPPEKNDRGRARTCDPLRQTEHQPWRVRVCKADALTTGPRSHCFNNLKMQDLSNLEARRCLGRLIGCGWWGPSTKAKLNNQKPSIAAEQYRLGGGEGVQDSTIDRHEDSPSCQPGFAQPCCRLRTLLEVCS